MNSADIADKIAETHGLTKSTGRAVMESVLTAIIDASAQGEEVSLPGFGKFKVQDKPEREGRNPSTGETITIAASKKLVFQPAKAVKDRLNP